MGRDLQGAFRCSRAIALSAVVVAAVVVATAQPRGTGPAVQTAVRHAAPTVAVDGPRIGPVGRRWG
jgi:hypothetical protein